MLLTNNHREANFRMDRVMKISEQEGLALQVITNPGAYLPDLFEWAPAHTHSFKGGLFTRIIVDGNGLSFFTKKTVVGSFYA